MIEYNKPLKTNKHTTSMTMTKWRLNTYICIAFENSEHKWEINEPLNIKSHWGNNTMP